MDRFKTGYVTISLKEYNELLEFKDVLEKNKLIIRYGGGTHYLSNDEAIRNFIGKLKEAQEELEGIHNRYAKMIDTIRNKSLWGFIKWRNRKLII